MKTRKTVDVWISRDGKDGEEPEMLFMHSKKPELIDGADGTWTAGISCMAVPELKHGRCKRIRLELDSQ